MMTISDLMSDLNHDCDHFFTDAEIAVARGDWSAATEQFALFCSTMEQHFAIEETILFPALAQEGAEMEQTRALSSEHSRMRDLFHRLAAALEQCDPVDYINLSEAMFSLLLQHNSKSEQVLYPMMDEVLSQRSEALVSEIEELTDKG